MAERVLTLRELNRATLARQLLLERKRLSPTAVIERLVGMQAQWPPAPYVGIWTRTRSFRREALERELARGAVLKATMMRQTLHLVTRHDYALVRAAMSETNHYDKLPDAVLLAPAVRKLAAAGPVTSAEALEMIERDHGLSGLRGRRAWRGARVRAHVLHHHETALWQGRPEGRFVAIEEPETHVPVEARAEILRRYLAAFGPASRRDIVAWAMMLVPEVQRAIDLLEPYAASATSTAANSSTSRARRCRIRTRPRPFGSCRSGTTCCSPSRIGRACSRRSTEGRSSA